jgi:hypothetical protein
MKNFSVLFVFVLAFAFSSCQFSKGVKKDLSTGLTASYNGFSIEDIFLVNEQNEKLNSNVIELGAEVKVMATGVENYRVKDGRVYPGCTLILTDKDRAELLNIPDLFANLPEGKAQNEAGTLVATLTTGEPMAPGETYHLHVKFFDKLKPASHITADVQLVVK